MCTWVGNAVHFCGVPGYTRYTVPGCTMVFLHIAELYTSVFVGDLDDANKKITVNILGSHYWPGGREVRKDLWIGYFTPPGAKIS